MKTVLLFLSFITSTVVFSQTNIISAKSHSANVSADMNEPDNFGVRIKPRTVQSVSYLKDDCIVEKYLIEWAKDIIQYDTICHHPFLIEGEINIDRIKAMYPDKTKFIGFDKLEKNQKKNEKKAEKQLRQMEKNRKKSSGSMLFLFGGMLFLTYLFIPTLKSSTSRQ